MKQIISFIIKTIIYYLKKFWIDFRIKQNKEEAVKIKKEVIHEVNEANDSYDDFKRKLKEYESNK